MDSSDKLSSVTSLKRGLRDKARQQWHAYAEKASLPGYAGAMAAFTGYCGALATVARLTGRPPAQLTPLDLVVGAAAVFRGSRLVSKNSVTSPLRAPFTEYVEPGAPAEVNERARGTGARHTVGELLTCPFCVSVWATATYLGGLTLLPRTTRLAAAGLTMLAAADFLQLAYTSVHQSATDDD